MNEETWHPAVSISLGVLIFIVLTWLFPKTMSASPLSGEAGQRRQEALAKTLWFQKVEPIIRTVSSIVSKWPIDDIRMNADRITARSGRVLGLDGNDLISCAIIVSILLSLLGGFATRSISMGWMPGAISGALCPIGHWRSLVCFIYRIWPIND